MRDSPAMKSAYNRPDSTALSLPQSSQSGARRLLPYNLIEAAAICSDAALILTTSVLTGALYHLAIFDHVGPVETFLGIGALAFVNLSAILAARGAYRPQNLANFWWQARETTAIWLLVFFVLSVAAFSLKVTETYSRGATLTFFFVGWSAIVVWRLIIARAISHALAIGAFAEQKIVLLGEEGQLTGSSVVDELKRCGYTPVQTFEYARNSISAAGASSAGRFLTPGLLKLMDEVVEVGRKESVVCVFLLASWDDRSSIERMIELLNGLSVPVYLLPDRNVSHFLGSRIVNIGTAWTAELKRAPLTATEQAAKRALDLLIASISLIMLTPMMMLVAALIKMESRGPVFFSQTRNGFNGRPFRIYKFRTMVVMEDGPVIRQATRDDARLTRSGRLLRRTNIDELPQLLNVLRGNMSLVGPRPHASAHNSKYEKVIANYALRYHVKPGLSGWAQIHGLRGETKTGDLMARRVEFDLWYINNWSLWLDLRILLRTLFVGFQPTAY
jgi:Undecaprenyl-phosphate glucose phosphotransferase